MRFRNIPSTVAGIWVSYWIPSSLQSSISEKLNLDKNLPTYASSVNAIYTAIGKASGGIALMTTAESQDKQFLTGATLLFSSAYSVGESYIRSNLSKKNNKPIPGLIIFGLEKLVEQSTTRLKQAKKTPFINEWITLKLRERYYYFCSLRQKFLVSWGEIKWNLMN